MKTSLSLKHLNILFLLIFLLISSTFADFIFSIVISETWTKMREFQWLVPVKAENTFQCSIYKNIFEKYKGTFVKAGQNNEMIYEFKLYGNENDLKKYMWHFECIVYKPLLIHKLVENLDQQVR